MIHLFLSHIFICASKQTNSKGEDQIMTITQADLKKLISYGAAKNITDSGTLPKGSRRITVTMGSYGANGALFVSESGKLYAIVARGGQLFKYI